MTQPNRNQEVKDYIQMRFVKEDPALIHARKHSQESGLPLIHVPSHVGQLLYLLTRLKAPKKCLEIGTLGGYSTLWLLKGLPEGGSLITLELEPMHAQIAKEHIANAGYENQAEVRLGDAKKSLEAMIENHEGPFDLIFIDADKEGYSTYLDLAYALSTTGTLILSDNLIPKGEPIENAHPNNQIAHSIYAYNQKLAAHCGLETTLITTLVGELGRIDAMGFSIVR